MIRPSPFWTGKKRTAVRLCGRWGARRRTGRSGGPALWRRAANYPARARGGATRSALLARAGARVCGAAAAALLSTELRGQQTSDRCQSGSSCKMQRESGSAARFGCVRRRPSSGRRAGRRTTSCGGRAAVCAASRPAQPLRRSATLPPPVPAPNRPALRRQPPSQRTQLPHSLPSASRSGPPRRSAIASPPDARLAAAGRAQS